MPLRGERFSHNEGTIADTRRWLRRIHEDVLPRAERCIDRAEKLQNDNLTCQLESDQRLRASTKAR